jgi:hypothetical protein
MKEPENLNEGIMDAFIVFKILKMLVTPWEKHDAYNYGIIDKDGNPLKKTKDLGTKKERGSYTILHRMVFGIKRLFAKIPMLKLALGSYAAALLLIKEESGMSKEDAETLFKKLVMANDFPIPLDESLQKDSQIIAEGCYTARNDILTTDGEYLKKGSKIVITKEQHKADTILGKNIFKIKLSGHGTIVCSHDDLRRS